MINFLLSKLFNPNYGLSEKQIKELNRINLGYLEADDQLMASVANAQSHGIEINWESIELQRMDKQRQLNYANWYIRSFPEELSN